MTEQVYKDMVKIMGQRGLGFAGKDIPEFYPLMEELFTPEEAAINNAMPQKTFTAAEMAEIMGTTEAEIAPKLKKMADKCLTQSYMKGDLRLFRANPLVPGILEFVFIPGGETERDKKLAQLIYAYKEAYTAESPMIVPFPMQRVITVDETVEAGNQVHTYDQVKTYIEKNDKISVGTCYCRHAAHLRGEDTHGMPMKACLFFGRMADYSVESLDAKKITKKEAYDILDECSAAGLVHQTSNVTDEIGYLCACDKWHCYSIKIFLQQAIPSAVFNSGFEPKFDPDKCTACETCIDRCPAIALEMGDDDVPVVDLNRCFGCAVCATGCDDDTITMVTKPGYATPPKDNNELMTSMFEAFSAQAK